MPQKIGIITTNKRSAMTFTIVILIIIAVIYFLSKSKKDNDYIGPGYQKWKAENDLSRDTMPNVSFTKMNIERTKEKLKLKIEGELEDTYLLPPFDDKHNKIILCKSESIKKIKYEVNLYQLTCTCPNFTAHRSTLPQNDIRRICKHIKKVMEDVKLENEIDNLSYRIILCATDVHPKSEQGRLFFTFSVNGNPVAVSFKKGNSKPWFDVFAKQPYKTTYEMYGYNPIEDRWSYNEHPAYEESVLKEFKKVVSLM